MFRIILIILVHSVLCDDKNNKENSDFEELNTLLEETDKFFVKGEAELLHAWKACTFDIGGVEYYNDTDIQLNEGSIFFEDETLDDEEKFFIKDNNVPFGISGGYYGMGYFITIPRTRSGIPSTVNQIVEDEESISPNLKPLDPKGVNKLISVYDTYYDFCSILWMVDTGFIDIPGARKQVKPPTLNAYKENGQLLFSSEISSTVLVNGTLTEGLTILGVDTNVFKCNDTMVYILDMASDGIIVYSLEDLTFRRLDVTDLSNIPVESQDYELPRMPVNFVKHTIASNLSTARERLESFIKAMRMSERNDAKLDEQFDDKSDIDLLDKRKYFYAVSMTNNNFLFTNKARDAMLCWCLGTKLVPENIHEVARLNPESSLYISDIQSTGAELMILVNRRFNSSQYMDASARKSYIFNMNCDRAVEKAGCLCRNNITKFFSKYYG